MARTPSQDARRRILDATRRLIHEAGPLQVRVDEIAEQAAVGKQTIYRWWPSKAELVLDALVDIADVELAFPEHGTAEESIRTEMRQVVRAFAGPLGALIRELVASAQGDTALADQLRHQLFAQRRARAAEALRRGIEQDEVRADLDLEAAIDALYAPLWIRLLIGHEPLNRHTADTILRVVWPGIAAPAAPAGRAPSKR